jgi:hypothetical protein
MSEKLAQAQRAVTESTERVTPLLQSLQRNVTRLDEAHQQTSEEHVRELKGVADDVNALRRELAKKNLVRFELRTATCELST